PRPAVQDLGACGGRGAGEPGPVAALVMEERPGRGGEGDDGRDRPAAALANFRQSRAMGHGLHAAGGLLPLPLAGLRLVVPVDLGPALDTAGAAAVVAGNARRDRRPG